LWDNTFSFHVRQCVSSYHATHACILIWKPISRIRQYKRVNELAVLKLNRNT
jgi:hypothetical protein